MITHFRNEKQSDKTPKYMGLAPVFFWRFLVFLIISIVIPNSLFVGFSYHFDLIRPLINFDYIVAALIVVAGYRVIGVSLFLVFLLTDIYNLIVQVFPIINSPRDLIEYAFFVLLASWQFIKIISIAAFFLLLVIGAVFFGGRYAEIKSGLITLNIALALYTYNVYSHSVDVDRQKAHQANEVYLLSQFDSYLSHAAFTTDIDYDKPLRKVEYKGELAAWSRTPISEFPERSLLIINESWGVNSNPAVNKAVLKPILERSDDLNNLRHGYARYSGSTVSAELRELCSLRNKTIRFADAESEFGLCLPKRLLEAGFQTYSMHGASGYMYYRNNWYPRAGFEKNTFFETKEWPRKCESFPGACDLDMRGEIINFFRSPDKRFMYWLTLNTHYSYSRNDLQKDVLDCELVGIPPGSETCRYLKLQAQFFNGLSEMLDSKAMDGVAVRVIGDHMPPITNIKERDKYFRKHEVGWIEFVVSAQ